MSDLSGYLSDAEAKPKSISARIKTALSNVLELEFLAVSDSDQSTLSRLKLTAGMLIAANLSATAIWLSCYLFAPNFVDYEFALGSFLAIRVYLYMYSRGADLTPEYVHTLSVQRSKWAAATILVSGIIILTQHAWRLIH